MKPIVKRQLILLLFILVLVLLGFIIYINQRAGPSYREDLARLLPEDVPVYLSVRNLSGLIDELANTPAIQRAMDSGALQQALFASKDWRKFTRQKQKIEALVPYTLGLDFIKKWMGKHLVFALCPAREVSRPAMIIMSKTAIGFEENLAEFVAQHLPGLKLSSSTYKEHLINTYRADKPRRCFSYTRFGRTVILSLRSPDISGLKKIIDFKIANSEQTLFTQPLFRQIFQDRENETGIIGLINLVPAIEHLGQALDNKEEELDYLRSAGINQLQGAALKIFIHNGLRTELLLLATAPDKSGSTLNSDKGEKLAVADTSFTLTAKDFGPFSDSICNLYIAPELISFLSQLWTEHQNKVGEPATSWLADLQELLDQENYITITGFIPSPIFPLPCLVWQPAIENSKEANELFTHINALLTEHFSQGNPADTANRIEASFATPLGTLSLIKSATNRLTVTLNYDRGTRSSTETGDLNLASWKNNLSQDIIFAGYLNFDKVRADVDHVRSDPLVLNKKLKRKLNRYWPWITLAAQFHYSSFWCQQDERLVRVALLLPLD